MVWEVAWLFPSLVAMVLIWEVGVIIWVLGREEMTPPLSKNYIVYTHVYYVHTVDYYPYCIRRWWVDVQALFIPCACSTCCGTRFTNDIHIVLSSAHRYACMSARTQA